MFGDYKESIEILERQRACHHVRLRRCAWWEGAERSHVRGMIAALDIAITALESAWHAEEEEFARKYLEGGAIDVEDLPYDAVEVYKRELAAKGGKFDA